MACVVGTALLLGSLLSCSTASDDAAGPAIAPTVSAAATVEAAATPTVPVIADAPTEINDYLLKLAVIEHLMYEQNVLEPFELSTVEEWAGYELYDGNWVVDEDDFYGFMPAVKEYFEQYDLTRQMLDSIECLEVGSSRIREVAPYWDGEDDLFHITAATVAGSRALPNLRWVRAPFRDQDLVAAYADQGITLVQRGSSDVSPCLDPEDIGPGPTPPDQQVSP